MSFDGCATRKEKRRQRQRRRRKEERIITLPVVSSNEGASTVFFTPNKRFILVRESLFCLSSTLIVVRTRCLRKNKKKKETFSNTLVRLFSGTVDVNGDCV